VSDTERGFDDWAGLLHLCRDVWPPNVADLFSADAVYHLNCHSRFKQKFPHTLF
jgi:hypothetical protein